MSVVAELLGKVKLDTSDVKKGAKDAEDAIDGVGEKASGLKGAVSKGMDFLGTLGLAVGGVMAVKDAVSGLMDAAVEDQQVQAQTAAVIKSTGDASGRTAEQMKDFGDQLQKVTPYSHDAVQSTENMIATFTNIKGDNFDEATKAALDLSQAMGQDTKSSAIQLGKALNDPAKGLTALQRVGVTFTDQQKKMIQTMEDTGNVAGAQKVILDELSKEFGGSATAAGKTFGGQMAILGHRFDDLKEKVGYALISGLNNFAGIMPRIGDGIDAVSSHIGQFVDGIKSGNLKKVIAGWGEDALAELKSWGGKLKDQAGSWLGDLRSALGISNAGGATGPAGTGGAAINTGMLHQIAAKIMGGVTGVIKQIGGALGGLVMDGLDLGGKLLGGLVQSVEKVDWGSLGSHLLNDIKGAIQFVVSHPGALIGGFYGLALGGPIGAAIGGDLTKNLNLGKILSDALSLGSKGLALGGKALGIGASILKNIQSDLAAVDWSGLKQTILSGLGRALSGGLALGGTALGIGASILSKVKSELSGVNWSGIGQTILQGLQNGGNLASQLGTWIGTQFSRINWTAAAGNLKTGLTNVLQSIGDSSVVTKLTTGLDDLHTKLTNLINSNAKVKELVDTLTKMGATDLSKLGDIFKTIGDDLGKLAANKNVTEMFSQLSQEGTKLQAALKPLGDILSIVGKGIGALAGVIATFTVAGMLAGLQGLLSLLQAALPGALTAAGGLIQTFTGIIQVIGSIVTGVVSIVDDLLHGKWSQAWTDAKTMVSGVVQGIINIVQGIGTQLVGLIAAATGMLLVTWQAGWNLLVTAVSDTITKVVSLAAGIGGKIKSAIGDLLGLLKQAGADVIQGLINGIEGKLGDLASEAGKIGSTIKGGVTGFLHINSPSKDMIEIGGGVGEGLVVGLQSGHASVAAAARALAGGIISTSMDELDEHSHSKKGKQVGTDWTGGVGDGVTAGTPAVAAAAKKTAKAITDPMRQVSTDVQTYSQEVQGWVSAMGDLDSATKQIQKNLETAGDFKDTGIQDAANAADAAWAQVQQDAANYNAATTADARASAKDQMDADKALAQYAQTQYDDMTTAATDAYNKIKQAATDTANAQKAVLDAQKSLSGDAQTMGSLTNATGKGMGVAINKGDLASDMALMKQAQTQAIQLQAAAQAADNAVLKDAQALASATASGSKADIQAAQQKLDLDKISAQSAHDSADQSKGDFDTYTKAVSDDQAALKQQTTDLASFDKDISLNTLDVQLSAQQKQLVGAQQTKAGIKQADSDTAVSAKEAYQKIMDDAQTTYTQMQQDEAALKNTTDQTEIARLAAAIATEQGRIDADNQTTQTILENYKKTIDAANQQAAAATAAAKSTTAAVAAGGGGGGGGGSATGPTVGSEYLQSQYGGDPNSKAMGSVVPTITYYNTLASMSSMTAATSAAAQGVQENTAAVQALTAAVTMASGGVNIGGQIVGVGKPNGSPAQQAQQNRTGGLVNMLQGWA